MNSEKAGKLYFEKYPSLSIWEVLKIACDNGVINPRSRKQMDKFLSGYENAKYPETFYSSSYIQNVAENKPIIFNLSN